MQIHQLSRVFSICIVINGDEFGLLTNYIYMYLYVTTFHIIWDLFSTFTSLMYLTLQQGCAFSSHMFTATAAGICLIGSI